MAKATRGKASSKAKAAVTTEPSYPYVVNPKSLRRFLELVPQRPKPPKVVTATLQTWGLKSGNDVVILRVMKDIGLLAPGGEPTPAYAEYMHPTTGAAALGRQIKICYEALFQNITGPEKASNEDLRSFFNIHSGGSERTIQLQVDTFKALAAYATFGESDPLNVEDGVKGDGAGTGGSSGSPAIRIDLHIHLPENKSKADYDAILESIATHLYKKRQ